MKYNQIGEETTGHFSRTHEHLRSFALSAMLTSAVLATAPEGLIAASAGPNMQAVFAHIQGSGFPGTAAMPSPAAVNTPHSVAVNTAVQPAAPISEQQLRIINKDLEARNKYATLSPEQAGPLGLTKNGEPLTLLFRATHATDGIRHAFFRLDGNAGYIVGQRTEKGMTLCRVDAKLNLVLAVTYPAGQPGVHVVTPLPEAAKILHYELSAWAGFADEMAAGNSQVAATVRP